MRAALWRLSLVVVACGAASAGRLEARGGKGAAPAKLPPGCERLCDGREAVLSLDGKRLAFVRWTTQGVKENHRGEPIPEPVLFVRDLAAKKESKVPGVQAVPVGWTQAGGVGVSTGVVVDARTGKVVPGTSRLPEKLAATALAWSRDGSRLAFVPDWQSGPLPTPGVPQVLSWVEAGGKLHELSFGNLVYAEQPASLAFSPDGTRLAYHVGYVGSGSLPFRRVALVSVEGGTQTVVSDMALDNRIPGMHDERLPMRALPGTTGPRMGDAVWDAAGRWFAYVHGTGDGNADVYVSDAEGRQKLRQTKDGLTKWSPALDPAGRRLAFLTAKVTDWPNGLEQRLLRVLDLATQEVRDLPLPGSQGMPGNVMWTPDGLKVLYEVHGGDAEGIYAQALPPAPDAAGWSGPGKVEVGQDDEILGALASGAPKRIAWACEEARKGWHARLAGPFRQALLKALPTAGYDAATDLLRLLGDMKVREALPEVRAALKHADEHVVTTAIATLQAWKAEEALPDLEALRAKHASAEVQVQAAGTMVALGDARGWPTLSQGAKAKDADVRARLCRALGLIRDVRSVDLLLGLVADDGFLYTTVGGDQVVGDQAVEALAGLTGQFFRRDVARWKAWWKDTAQGVLPANPDTAAALAQFQAWMDEREEEHQRKMREKLGPLLPPR